MAAAAAGKVVVAPFGLELASSPRLRVVRLTGPVGHDVAASAMVGEQSCRVTAAAAFSRNESEKAREKERERERLSGLSV